MTIDRRMIQDGRRLHIHQQRFACHFTMLLSMVNSGWRVR